MSESIHKMKQANRWTSAQETAIDEVDDAMKRLRICPRKVLGSLSHLRIDKARIEPIESQAPKAGGKADVEAAIFASQPPRGSSEFDDTEYVALKKLRWDPETDDDRALAPLAHEVSLLNDLSHENVVSIVGFVEEFEQGVAWMVFAWEKNGNLREFIRSTNWELPERVSLIDDVARGLSYLHGRIPAICHGDLKSLNILVNSENQALITDFGSARAVDLVAEGASEGVSVAQATTAPHLPAMRAQDADAPTAEIAPSGDFITMTGPAWTVRWAAPELLRGDVPGLASDIWALGWVCWEAVTGNFPFDEDSNVLAIVRITKGDLPTVENDDQLKQIKTLCSMMRECWKLDTSKRPTAAKVQQTISFMDQAEPSRPEGNSLSGTRSSALLFALGWIQRRNAMFPEAREHFEQSLKVAQSVGDEEGKAWALKAIGDTWHLQGEYSKAEEWYTQARDTYSQIGSELGFAQSVKGLGDVRYMRNEDSKAEELYTQALNIYSKIGDQLGLAQSVDSLGDVYRIRGDHSEAEESYIQARNIYSQIGNQLGFAQSVKNLGNVYRMRKEYSKAEESYIQARDLSSRIGDDLGFAQSVNHLGNVYFMQKEYSRAEESYMQARDICSRIGDQHGSARSLEGMGHVHSERGEYAKAEESYLEARRIYHRIGEMYSMAKLSWALGYLHVEQAQYDKTVRLFREASAIYAGMGLEQDVEDCNDVIEEILLLTA